MSILDRFFKFTLLYTAVGYDDYFRIVDKLIKYGIKYKTKTNIAVSRSRSFVNNDKRLYHFYVKKEDERKAIEAINT